LAESGSSPIRSGSQPLAQATGRRKEAVCRARLIEGSGRWEINGRPLEDYFPSATHRMMLAEPLRITKTEGRYDVIAKVEGGGVSGQAGALRHALARALVELDTDLRPILKKSGFLTRDAREKERRKYGLKKARKAPQYSKR
jgi:small subunit ribosomal protein S9